MAPPAYRFGEFRFDPARRELWRGDEEVALSHSAFKCIVYLIENRDRAIGHDELIEAVWETTHLSDGVVAQAILTARHALGDSGKKQRFIKTVRGFGYRWGVPVETVEATVGTMDLPSDSSAGATPRSAWLRIALAVLGIGALLGGAIYLWRDTHADTPDVATSQPGEGSIALLLPVTVEAEERHAWVRLGVMDLIATRLREAGQAMVPSDTVVALQQGHSSEPSPDELDRLSTTTGAHLVLAAQAQVTGTRWTVSLRSLLGAQPPLTAVGEAHDVLEAAQAAADQMARSLGLTPAAEPENDPPLQRLLQQIEAALLGQQMNAARALIENADPRLREHPEIRFQRGRIEYYGHHLDTAQAAFESLLQETSAERDPRLRTHILHLLAGVHYWRGDYDASAAILEEALQLPRQDNASGAYGTIRRSLGLVMAIRGDFDAATLHMAHARRALESVGDIQGLAVLDGNLALLELLRERPGDAMPYLKSAAERYQIVGDVAGELRTLGNMIYAHLWLLDPQAAMEVEARQSELLSRTSNPKDIAGENLAQEALLAATGRLEAAEGVLTEVLSGTNGSEGLLRNIRVQALARRAEHVARDGDPIRAARLATEVVEGLPLADTVMRLERGRAWLTLIRAQITQNHLSAAAESLAAMSEWAEPLDAHAPRIYATLARAELAAAKGRLDAAGAAFEHALALADSSRVPLYSLQVAESYVPWLLADGSYGVPDPERALAVVQLVTRYSDQHYEAALLQLRVYHALGPRSAWRTALDRTRSLAGERQIPPELLAPPTPAPRPTPVLL